MARQDDSTSEWYNRYYKEKGSDRNELLRNAGVLFQALSYEVSNLCAVRSMKLSPLMAKVLDVGCGMGAH